MVKVSQEWRVPITYKYLSIYEGNTCSWAFIKSLTLFMNGDLCLEREFLWEVKVFRVFGLWGWKTFYVSKSHNIPKIANYNFPFIQMSMDGIYQTTYAWPCLAPVYRLQWTTRIDNPLIHERTIVELRLFVENVLKWRHLSIIVFLDSRPPLMNPLTWTSILVILLLFFFYRFWVNHLGPLQGPLR